MSSPEVAQGRPGLKVGRSNEFTLLLRLKSGGAERMRRRYADPNFAEQRQGIMDGMRTVHDVRFVIFDDDTRLFFASTFDGDWDTYINDFATSIPDYLDRGFGEAEGYPGIRSPDIKDWIVKHQVTAADFYSAYPNASVRDILKAQKIKGALEVLLDQATG
jgi:hypothetical protein